MIVLRHYFLDVLALPKPVFERILFFILGDRLTTARDRAAQSQRAVDRSMHKVDRLASFRMVSGVMHVCMNQIQNIGKYAWGGDSDDSVALKTLRDILPNRSGLNTKKIDFYGWLQFMDATLFSLVMKAAMTELQFTSTNDLTTYTQSYDGLMELCAKLTDSCLLPSLDRLGHTKSGHAVLLMHDLMTMREMRHAIKHGHPERIKRMLK
jgi:hypothetical protein